MCPKSALLLPFLNGEDVNSRPDQSPSRLVVNFFDWPLDRESSSEGYAGYTASDFPECLEIVRQRVKPEHDRSNRKVYREKWWQYAEKQSKLYDLIARLRRVIVIPLVSKYLVMSWQELGPVFSHALGVIVSDDDSDFALLQSTIHEDWARQFGSTLETRMRYALTDCYETFPFPAKGPKLRLREAGSAYHEHRLAVARNRQEGLTKTYNRFHDPGESHADVQRLRELHVEIDGAVSSRVWLERPRSRPRLPRDQARALASGLASRLGGKCSPRLLKLNHERYAEEVKQGLHGKKAKGKPAPSGRGRRPKASPARRASSLGTMKASPTRWTARAMRVLGLPRTPTNAAPGAARADLQIAADSRGGCCSPPCAD